MKDTLFDSTRVVESTQILQCILLLSRIGLVPQLAGFSISVYVRYGSGIDDRVLLLLMLEIH